MALQPQPCAVCISSIIAIVLNPVRRNRNPEKTGGEDMSGEKSSPQFQGAVQFQSALMGLALAYKQKYGDEALEVAKSFTKQLGVRLGNQLKERTGVAGSGLKDIEKVLHAWQDPTVLGPPTKSTIEGSKLTMTREAPTQCPALAVAKQMNLPIELVCNTVAFPMFRGVAEAVNPKAKHTSVKIASKECIDAIEIP